jgi:hypothetical protein
MRLLVHPLGRSVSLVTIHRRRPRPEMIPVGALPCLASSAVAGAVSVSLHQAASFSRMSPTTPLRLISRTVPQSPHV